MPTSSLKSSYGAIIILVLCFLGLVASDNYHASIKNRLGSGKNLTVHCQSKDNDLGQRNVTDGSEYSWDFGVNVWGTTLFYCDIGWDKVQEFHFGAFDYGRDFVRCRYQCLWIVAEEGMYGLNAKTGLWEYMYNWSS